MLTNHSTTTPLGHSLPYIALSDHLLLLAQQAERYKMTERPRRNVFMIPSQVANDLHELKMMTNDLLLPLFRL